jgi:hypothetical protein
MLFKRMGASIEVDFKVHLSVHFLMGVRVVIDAHQDIRFSTDEAKKATLRTLQRRSEEQWLEEVRQEHLLLFEPLRAPLIWFVFIFSRRISELIACQQNLNILRINDFLCVSAPPSDICGLLQSPFFFS